MLISKSSIRSVFYALSLILYLPVNLCSAETEGLRPNVLWITSEDNAAHWLGCYGNQDAHTPRLDALAAESILFSQAYSNSPVCAVARSTILRGAYATTTGTQHMRSRYAIPNSFKPYVTYLQEQGYYCTNNNKTDYNFKGDDQAIWDACSWKAHYKNRSKEKPFFAIFNTTISHESSLFPDKVSINRKQGIIPKTTRLDPNTLFLPPHVPDLPEVRSDFAIYYDNLTAMDTKVGQLLDELEQRGLADDTIVFYYSDHGGPTPRGKRYLKDTGVRVPLLIRIPPKWQHLSPFKSGEHVNELVSFVDLAPTLLSLCGLKIPTQMQGRAFLGERRVAPPTNASVFLFADRFDGISGMRRGITDGQFKYIRKFTPHLPAAPYSYYSLSMPSWAAWQKAWQSGELTDYHKHIWEAPQPAEELYDTAADPWEINNLAGSAEHAGRIASMRDRLRDMMLQTYDTGLIPEAMFYRLCGNQSLHQYVHADDFNIQSILDLAFLASVGQQENLQELLAACRDTHPVARYWGALGCQILGKDAANNADVLREMLHDAQAAVRMVAAGALYSTGFTREAKDSLLSELRDNLDKLDDPESIILVHSLTELNASDEVPNKWITATLNDSSMNEYIKKFAQRLRAER